MSLTRGGLGLGSGPALTSFCRSRAENSEVGCSSSLRSSWSGPSKRPHSLVVGRQAHRHRMMAGNTASAGLGMEMAERAKTILESLEQFATGGDLPAQYRVKEGDRPDVEYNEWGGSVDIPVLDLSRMDSDRAGLSKQMGDAAKEYGFFQIINHGLSLEELKELQSHGYDFFGLPPEVKSRAYVENDQNGFEGDNSKKIQSSLHWAESLTFRRPYVDEMVRQVWPDGNEKFRNAAHKFCTASEIINRQILELLAESVGLGTDFFSQHLNARRTMIVRWNFYPACPQPSDVLGAGSHTDGCCITILQQDSVGGLQIRKDGKWIGIKPIEGALVINVGDILHAWTNGNFKSVLHRATVNKTVHRLSLANFLSVDGDLTIHAPDELIDKEHPRLYRPFKALDYIQQVIRMRLTGEVDGGDGQVVLDGFRVQDAPAAQNLS